MLKVVNFIKIGIILLTTILAAMVFITEDLNQILAATSIIWVSQIILVVAVLITLASAIYNLIESPQKAKRLIIGVLSLVILFFIGWLTSYPIIDEEMGEPVPGSQLVGAGIFLFFSLITIALLLLVVDWVKKLLK